MSDNRKVYLYKSYDGQGSRDITKKVLEVEGFGMIHRKLESEDGAIFYDRCRILVSLFDGDISTEYTHLAIQYNGYNRFWGKIDWDLSELRSYPTTSGKYDTVRSIEAYDPLKDLKGMTNYGTALDSFPAYRYIGQYFTIDSHLLADGLHTIKCTPEENPKHSIRKCRLQLNDGGEDIYDEEKDLTDGKKLYDSEGNWVLLKRGVDATGWNYIRNEMPSTSVDYWWGWRLENTWVKDKYIIKAVDNTIYVPPFCITNDTFMSRVIDGVYSDYVVDLGVDSVVNSQIMTASDVTSKITDLYGSIDDIVSFEHGDYRWLGVITHSDTHRYFILFKKDSGTWYERGKSYYPFNAGAYGGSYPECKMRLVKRKVKGADNIEQEEYAIILWWLNDWNRVRHYSYWVQGDAHYTYFYYRPIKNAWVFRVWEDGNWVRNEIETFFEDDIDGETIDLDPLTGLLYGMRFHSERYEYEDEETGDRYEAVKVIPNGMCWYDFFRGKAYFNELNMPSPVPYKHEVHIWQDPIAPVKNGSKVFDEKVLDSNIRIENAHQEGYSAVRGGRLDTSGKDFLASASVRLDNPYRVLAYKDKYFRPNDNIFLVVSEDYEWTQTPFGLLRKFHPILINPVFQYLYTRSYPSIQLGRQKVVGYNMIDDEYCLYSAYAGDISVYENYHKNTLRIDDFDTFSDSLDILDYVRQRYNAVLSTDAVNQTLKLHKIGTNEVKTLTNILESDISISNWDKDVSGVEFKLGDETYLVGTREREVIELQNPLSHNAGYYYILKDLADTIYSFYSQDRDWLIGLEATLNGNEEIQIGDIFSWNDTYWLIIAQKDDLNTEKMILECWSLKDSEVQ